MPDTDPTLKAFERTVSPERSEQQVHFERTNMYRSCCFVIDRRAAKFFAQLFLTLIMLGFCFWQISLDNEKLGGPIWALIGTFVGFWFDSPTIPYTKG